MITIFYLIESNRKKGKIYIFFTLIYCELSFSMNIWSPSVSSASERIHVVYITLSSVYRVYADYIVTLIYSIICMYICFGEAYLGEIYYVYLRITYILCLDEWLSLTISLKSTLQSSVDFHVAQCVYASLSI